MSHFIPSLSVKPLYGYISLSQRQASN